MIRQEIRVALVSNGYLIDDGCAKKLSDMGIESIAISIDGPEFLHDAYRMRGSYRKAIDAIDRLIKYGNVVSVITTLNAENILHLESLYHELCQHKIFAWQLQACSPMGNAAKNNIEYQIDFQTVIDFVNRYGVSSPFIIGIADNIGYYSDREGFLRGNCHGKGYFLGCRAGLTALAIDSIGNVRGCESMYDDKFIEGNLRKRSLRDIWEDPKAFSYNRDFEAGLLEGKCRTCDKGPICAGGCRSYNYFDHGNIYQSIRCVRNCRSL